MEHAVGEIVTLPNGRKAEVVEFNHPYCGECVYRVIPRGCSNPIRKENRPTSACGALSRTDHKNIIYKEIKEADMKAYQEYYNDYQNSTESRDLSFEEWLMLLLDKKEKEMIDENDTQGGITIDNWKDVKELIDIADRVIEVLDKKELLQIGATGYYSRVLVEYGKYKELKGTELELELELEKYRQRENEVY